MIFDEIVDVLAEEIKVGLGEHPPVRFRVHDKLQEQHKEQIERLEVIPVHFGAYCSCKLEEPVCDADTTAC